MDSTRTTLGPTLESALYLVQIGHIHESCLDAKSGHVLAKHRVRAAIQLAARDDGISGFDHRQQGDRYCAEAGGKGHRVVGILEVGHDLFEYRDVWVGVSASI